MTAAISEIIVASFDPSSTAIGYAKHVSNPSPNVEPELLDAGIIKPERERDESNVRIETMVREAMSWLRDEGPRPDVIVIEDTVGKVGTYGRARGMNGAGLAIYGKAIGWLMGVARGTGIEVVPILENVWTGGERKAKRLEKCLALHYGRYKPEDDPGGDTGDAIMIGRYYCFERLYERTKS